MKKIIQQKGFTLIELLVVIAVLGMLAAVIMVSTNAARARARDGRRAADISQISKALELYYSEHGVYPAQPNDSSTPKKNWGNMLLDLQAEGLISFNHQELGSFSPLGIFVNRAQAIVGPPVDDPLKIVPQDPQYPEKYYSYMVSNDFKNYRIRAKFEDLNSKILESGLSGTFSYPGSETTTGEYACDKSLGYYCVGSTNGF